MMTKSCDMFSNNGFKILTDVLCSQTSKQRNLTKLLFCVNKGIVYGFFFKAQKTESQRQKQKQLQCFNLCPEEQFGSLDTKEKSSFKGAKVKGSLSGEGPETAGSSGAPGRPESIVL